MKAPLLVMTFSGALLLAWGCGGNVVVDGAPPGSGGGAAGSGGSGTSSTSNSTSGAGFTCNFGCGGPIGLCGCVGPCSDGKTRAIGCGTTPSGVTCTCQVDNQEVGQCDQPSLVCVLPESCCALIFSL